HAQLAVLVELISHTTFEYGHDGVAHGLVHHAAEVGDALDEEMEVGVHNGDHLIGGAAVGHGGVAAHVAEQHRQIPLPAAGASQTLVGDQALDDHLVYVVEEELRAAHHGVEAPTQIADFVV